MKIDPNLNELADNVHKARTMFTLASIELTAVRAKYDDAHKRFREAESIFQKAAQELMGCK